MRRLVCTFTLLAAALAIPVRAEDTTIRATVPFDVEMTGAVLPSGNIQIQLMTGCVVRVYNPDAREGAFGCVHRALRTDQSEDPIEAKLVFNKYGDRAFLTEIWSPNFVLTLPRSRQEHELVTSRITAGVRPVRVEIIATAQ